MQVHSLFGNCHLRPLWYKKRLANTANQQIGKTSLKCEIVPLKKFKLPKKESKNWRKHFEKKNIKGMKTWGVHCSNIWKPLLWSHIGVCIVVLILNPNKIRHIFLVLSKNFRLLMPEKFGYSLNQEYSIANRNGFALVKVKVRSSDWLW